MQPNIQKNVLIYGLFIAMLARLTFALFYVVGENSNNVLAQVGEQQQNNQTSIAHDAKGHKSHQVIIFQNSSEGLKYTGMVTFDLSKPADIISFEEITEVQQQPVNATKKIWEVGEKKFVPSTLLKNVTEGSIGFNGSGILAHSTSEDKYTASYILNDTAIRNNNNSSNQ